MTWPDKKPGGLDAHEKTSFGKGIFKRCDGCGHTLPAEELAITFEVCPSCGQHHKLSSARWVDLVLDAGSLEEWDRDLSPADPLGFSDGKAYPDRVAAARKNTGAQEAILTGRATLEGRAIGFGLFQFAFMGGSMGSVVGEKIARLFERSIEAKLPVVLLQASGGARMQEGILSLMQMAKTVSARERLKDAGLPFVSAMLHPTTGGVAASFAFLGDVNVAEKGALVGFAGPRVIETTIRQTLPEGFQRSEFLLDHGMVDLVTSRLDLKATVARVLDHLGSAAAGAAAKAG